LKDTDTAADLFALRTLGNIYSTYRFVSRGMLAFSPALMSRSLPTLRRYLSARIMNPTNDVLEKRFAAMSGGAAALALSSGTAACFYSIINCASNGDNFVSAGNLYGGTFTQFHDILPQFGA
jgi:O-acetylhomoserine (thiol)-lyase